MLLKIATKVRLQSLVPLLRVTFTHIDFLYPTYLATKQCMAISTRHFNRKHYNNGQANAFRHALWNYLIAKKCTHRSNSKHRILNWTKSITDWHETAFANRELATAMDMHNNAIGRKVFLEDLSTPLEEVLAKLLKLAAQSIKITTTANLDQYPLSLVHLTDDQ